MNVRLKIATLSLLVMAPVSVFATQGNDAKTIDIGVVGAAKQSLTAKAAEVVRVLNAGDRVIFEETINTDANGQTQLIFVDKSTLTIGPNASVKIDKFVFDPSKSNGELAVSSTKGVLRFVGGALSKKKPVTITTPSATIGIRGGIALVDVQPNGETNATFVYGDKMTVQNAAGIQETTTPGMGIGVTSPNTPPTPPVKVDPSMMASSNNALMGSSDGAPPPPSGGDNSQNNDNQSQSDNNQNGNNQDNDDQQSANKEGDGSNPPPADDSQQPTGQNNDGSNPPPQKTADGNTPPPPAGNQPPPPSGNFASFDGNQPPPPPPPPGGNLNGGILPPPPVDTNIASQDNNQQQLNNQVNNTTSTNPPPTSFTGLVSVAHKVAPGSAIDADMNVGVDAAGNFVANSVAGSGQRLSPLVSGWNSTGTYGNNISLYLPKPAVVGGYGTLNIPFPNTLESATAITYSTPNMSYYSFDLPAQYASNIGAFGGDRMSLVFGRQANVSLATGVKSYRFLPEMLLYGMSESPLDMAILKSNLLPADLNNRAMVGNPGMLVDWDMDKSIMAGILWSSGSIATGENMAGIRLFMDTDVNKAAAVGTDLVIDGSMHEFSSKVQNASSASPTNLSEYGKVDYDVEKADIYGTSTGVVDGFVIDGTKLPSAAGGQTKATQHVGVNVVPQPAISPRLANNLVDQGFTAGFLSSTNTSTNSTSHDFLYNENSSGFTLYRYTNGEAGVDMNLNRGGTANSVIVGLGTTGAGGTTVNSDSVMINDKLYGMGGSGNLYYNTGGATTASNFKAALVSGGFADQTLGCSDCQFVHWGAWAGNQDVTATGGASSKDAFNVVPYVAGQMTTATQFASAVANLAGATAGSTSNVEYNGKVIGSTVENNVLYHNTGSFNSTIRLVSGGSSSVTAFNGNLGTHTFSKATPTSLIDTSTGVAKITGLTLDVDGATYAGHANGALFGPNAENIGGNLKFDTGTAKGAGVYIGKR